jgi:hypothetical protein
MVKTKEVARLVPRINPWVYQAMRLAWGMDDVIKKLEMCRMILHDVKITCFICQKCFRHE